MNISSKAKNQWRKTVTGYIFLLPVIVGLALFTILPLCKSLYYSFTEYDNITSPVWIGVRNFVSMWSEPFFVKSVGNTFLYAFVSVPLGLFCSFFLALALSTNLKGIKVFRALFYLPVILPAVASGVLITDLFSHTYGIYNRILTALGMPRFPFFAAENTAMFSLILYGLWGMGSSMLIWLAGFRSVSETYYEVAKIEGGGPFWTLFHVTIPMTTPTIFYNLVMGIINAMQIFTPVYVITSGGPNGATSTLAYLIYIYGLSYWEMGLASAMAWFLFVIIMGMTLIVFKTNKWVYYEGDSAR